MGLCMQAHAAPASKPPCCDFAGCFQNAAGAQSYESQHHCQLCNPCTQTVDKLKALPLPAGDPTDGFTIIQTCIASTACGDKAKLNNPAWLDRVVPAFVTPFIQQSGDWPAVEKTCRDRPKWLPFRDLLCQSDMANYHIKNDLQNALDDNGCGTTADWTAVGNIITQCILAGYASYPPGIKQTFLGIANFIVQNKRNSVRGLCTAYRTKNHLPVDSG